MSGMKPNVCLMHGLTSIHGQNKRKLSPLIAPFGNHSFDIANASIAYHLSSLGRVKVRDCDLQTFRVS